MKFWWGFRSGDWFQNFPCFTINGSWWKKEIRSVLGTDICEGVACGASWGPTLYWGTLLFELLSLWWESCQLNQMWTTCSTCVSKQRWRPTLQLLSGWHLFLYLCFFWNTKLTLLQNYIKQQPITPWAIITTCSALTGSCLFTYRRCNSLIFLMPFTSEVSPTIKNLSCVVTVQLWSGCVCSAVCVPICTQMNTVDITKPSQ